MERERDHLSDWRRDTDSYRKEKKKERKKERKKGALLFFSQAHMLFFLSSLLYVFSRFVSIFLVHMPLSR